MENENITGLTDFRGKYESRSLRNNNPGNIRATEENKWRGELSKEDSTDHAYEQFESIEHGVRALGIDLTTKINKHKLTNIDLILNKFAPDFENNTEGYITRAEKITGFHRYETLTPDFSTLKKLIRAISSIEAKPYESEILTYELIEKGLRMIDRFKVPDLSPEEKGQEEIEEIEADKIEKAEGGYEFIFNEEKTKVEMNHLPEGNGWSVINEPLEVGKYYINQGVQTVKEESKWEKIVKALTGFWENIKKFWRG